MYQYKELKNLDKLDLKNRAVVKALFSKIQMYESINNNLGYEEIYIEPYENTLELFLKSKKIKYTENLKIDLSRYEIRKKGRKQTTKKRIIKMLEEKKKDNNKILLFMTFTFNNKHINNTIDKDIRNIKECFKKMKYIDYIFNIDYGKKGNRKHYHAIALFNNKIDTKLWKQGNLDITQIKLNSDENKLNEYILKLNQHCYKEMNKGDKVIYARKHK